MASPLTLYLYPTFDLVFDLVYDDLYDKDVAPDFSIKPIAYEIKNTEKFHLIDGVLNRSFSGILSPVAKVTLPRSAKLVAGIPETAMWYSYIHPPDELAENIDWEKCADEQRCNCHEATKFSFNDELNEAERITSNVGSVSSQKKESLTTRDVIDESCPPCEHLSIFGGFVYFDESMKMLCINIATSIETKYVLHLAGPFKTPDTVIDGILAMERAKIIPLAMFHEGGFVAIAWVRPNETFQSYPATEMHPTAHGSFVFFRDDKSSITYTVSTARFVDPTGDVERISELLDLSTRSLINLDPKPEFMKACVKETDVTIWKGHHRQNKHMGQLRSSIVQSPVEEAQNKTSIRWSSIHEACYANTLPLLIKDLVYDNEVERNALDETDEFGFTPLHYAARFSAQNEDLIQTLVEACPESLSVKDQFGRMPLHLACGSRASAAVIKILIDADVDKVAIYNQTKYLKLLPLHIATNQQDADIDIIKALIAADESRSTLRHATTFGRIPLHNVIAWRLSPDIVQLLLDEESMLGNGVNTESDIFQMYWGFLPIELACYNHCAVEVISLLLDKDEKYESISTLVRKRGKMESFDMEGFYDNTTISSTFDSNYTDDVFYHHSPMALHLAITSGLTDAVLLILQKEIEIQNSPRKTHCGKAVFCKDQKGRTPLALACLSNADPSIIRTLLDLDPKKLSLYEEDHDGYLPIQHLCRHRCAYLESLEMLLDTKKVLYWRDSSNSHLQPLLLSIQAGANVDNIDLLLNPRSFTIAGLKTNRYVASLAKMIKAHPKLQQRIVHKLAERKIFFLMFVRLYFNIIACVTFTFISEDLIRGKVHQMEIVLLSICVAFFTARELVQVLSEKWGYLVDASNIIEFANLVSLVLALINISNLQRTECYDHMNCDTDKFLMILTFCLLLINTLRSFNASFLQFARFSSGLYSICVTLIPFFIACVIFLAIFTYAYRMLSVYDQTFQKTILSESCNATSALTNCVYVTFTHFVSGNENIEGLIEILFGVFAAVILLNVVIAIISEVWEEAGERAAITFWRSRLQLLSETSIFHDNNSYEEVRKYYFTPLQSKVSWGHDYPFHLVKSRYEYERPEDFFDTKIAKKIHAAHSLEASLRWMRIDCEIRGESSLQIRKKQMRATLIWTLKLLMYILVLIAGLCTIGLIWPQEIRESVMSIGQDEVDTEDENEKRNVERRSIKK